MMQSTSVVIRAHRYGHYLMPVCLPKHMALTIWLDELYNIRQSRNNKHWLDLTVDLRKVTHHRQRLLCISRTVNQCWHNTGNMITFLSTQWWLPTKLPCMQIPRYLPLLEMFGALSSENPEQFQNSFLNCLSHSSLALLSAISNTGKRSRWRPHTYEICWLVSNMVRHIRGLKLGNSSICTVAVVLFVSDVCCAWAELMDINKRKSTNLCTEIKRSD